MRFIDLTGQQFGRLTVIEKATKKNNHHRWLCRCSCGNTRTVQGGHLRDKHVQSCGCLHKENCRNAVGQHARNWKGGRHIDGDGYVRVTIAPRTRKPEHILIVETRLGRRLLSDELVHHKNGIRSDNRDDNLELRVKAKHPMGATVSDLLAWADELIVRYRSWRESGEPSRSC